MAKDEQYQAIKVTVNKNKNENEGVINKMRHTRLLMTRGVELKHMHSDSIDTDTKQRMPLIQANAAQHAQLNPAEVTQNEQLSRADTAKHLQFNSSYTVWHAQFISVDDAQHTQWNSTEEKIATNDKNICDFKAQIRQGRRS